MTAKEAIDKGIRLVRLPIWDEWSYLELPANNADGTHGPWAMLYDPISALVLRDHGDGADFPRPLIFTLWHEEHEFVEFTGPRLTPEDIRANKHIEGGSSR